MTLSVKLMAIGASAAVLAACTATGTTERNAAYGAAAGAVAGAVIGNNVGDGNAERGAIIGGAWAAQPERPKAVQKPKTATCPASRIRRPSGIPTVTVSQTPMTATRTTAHAGSIVLHFTSRWPCFLKKQGRFIYSFLKKVKTRGTTSTFERLFLTSVAKEPRQEVGHDTTRYFFCAFDYS